MARAMHQISPFKAKDQYKAWLQLQDMIDDVGLDHIPCSQAPDFYHPSSDEKYYLELAKKACVTCPLLKPCGIYAIKYEKEGIWGGMSANERLKLRRAAKGVGR